MRTHSEPGSCWWDWGGEAGSALNRDPRTTGSEDARGGNLIQASPHLSWQSIPYTEGHPNGSLFHTVQPRGRQNTKEHEKFYLQYLPLSHGQLRAGLGSGTLLCRAPFPVTPVSKAHSSQPRAADSRLRLLTDEEARLNALTFATSQPDLQVETKLPCEAALLLQAHGHGSAGCELEGCGYERRR